MLNGEIGLFNSGETDLFGIGNMLHDNQALKTATNKKEIEVIFVVEHYIMTSKISPSPWSLETTGIIRYVAEKNQIPLNFSMTSAHKSLIKDDVIKRAGLWLPGQGHAMDAVRVCLWYLITKKRVLQQCLIK